MHDAQPEEHRTGAVDQNDANPLDSVQAVHREEHSLEATWDYSSLGVSDVQAALTTLEERVSIFESVRVQINDSIPVERFIEILCEYDAICGDRYAIELRTELPTTVDTKDESAMAEQAAVSTKLADINRRLVFFEIAFQALSDDSATTIIAQSGKHKHYLERIRSEIPHTLSEKEESLLLGTNPNGIDAVVSVGDTLRSKLVFTLGNETLNESQIRERYQSNDRTEREAAYTISLETYGAVREELGKIYTARVNHWALINGKDYRNFNRPISARNHTNDLPDAALDALLEVCRRNHGIFQEFFDLKRERLGLSVFERHDVYAPVASTDVKLTYQQATNLVLTAFDEFSSRFGTIARAIQTTGHVDAAPRDNKRGGAFCAGAGLTSLPFVLENFTGTVNDASIKAHELGHGIHDVLAQSQTNLTWHPGLPIAETASTFSEHLFGAFLERERPELAEYLLFHSVSSHYATIVRQATFGDFEIAAHDMIAEGATLSELSAMYLEGLRNQLGPDINVHERFANEWLVVPHFVHAPFYVPAYAFGELFSLALFQQYQEEGPEFARKVEDLLSLGGSVSPVELCGRVGFDVVNPDHWQRGFDLVAQKVERLREIVRTN